MDYVFCVGEMILVVYVEDVYVVISGFFLGLFEEVDLEVELVVVDWMDVEVGYLEVD